MTSQRGATLVALLLAMAPARADDPCQSGLQTGQRPGPYSFVLATGAERGKSTCYICETGDKPAVIVFARTPNDMLGKLVAGIDKAMMGHKALDLRAWVTFLGASDTGLEESAVKWGREHAIRNVPLGVFEDPIGPPSYRLAKDADVTVLVFVKQKVTANFAFRAGELNADRIEEVLKTLPPGEKK
jgi:hypothetical protein